MRKQYELQCEFDRDADCRCPDETASLLKLNALLSVMMTKFHAHRCPKLAQFIVRHIHLLLERPEIQNNADSQALYLQLLQQWQKIISELLQQPRQKTARETILH